MLIRNVALIVAAITGTAYAQPTALRAGHLVNPATGTSTADQIILVDGTRIAAVGDDVDIPSDAQIIDLSDSWVVPGLMDAHTHLTTGARPGEYLDAPWTRESTALRALRGARNARVVLEAGFTTVRDVGNDGNYAAVDLRKAIDAGFVPGSTMITTGKIIAPLGGQVTQVPFELGPFGRFEYIDADTHDEIKKAVRQNVYYGATAIKLVADSNRYYYSEEDIRVAVDEARLSRPGLAVAVHASGGEPARNAILAGADSIEHGERLSDELLRLMKERGTVLVGTEFPRAHWELVFGPSADGTGSDFPTLVLNRLKRAHRIGVTMAFGTDVITAVPGRSRAEMMLDYLDVWIEAGVPAADTLRAMTTNAARLLRVDDRRGAITAGLAADIVATRANPLADIGALKQIHFVMKDGAIIRHEP